MRMRRLAAVAATGLLVAPSAQAQHEDHARRAAPPATVGPAGRPSGLELSPRDLQADPMGVLGRRMSLHGSGTSWQPESSPMGMEMRMQGAWLWQLHGNGMLSWNGASGPRGYGELSFPNWGMLMGSRVLGAGILDLRAMGSLDPFTTPPGGTAQLFQTGESFGGRPLVDRQHPHDLFMELAGRYTVPLATGSAVFFYGGPVGEPALGPNAYMHRASAADNAMAPLSHHLQDSTHIAMGVLTGGLQWNRWQLEGSWFRGKEPDENRSNIDFGPLDSVAARLSLSPSRNWVMQLSSGYLTNPEELEPGDLVRSTASLHHNQPMPFGNWASSLVWGQNRELAEAPIEVSNSMLVESTLDWAARNHAYGRYEGVDKEGLGGGIPGGPISRIHALTLGLIRDVRLEPVVIGVGGDVTLHAMPAELEPSYGAMPLSFRVFVRMRPPHRGH